MQNNSFLQLAAWALNLTGLEKLQHRWNKWHRSKKYIKIWNGRNELQTSQTLSDIFVKVKVNSVTIFKNINLILSFIQDTRFIVTFLFLPFPILIHTYIQMYICIFLYIYIYIYIYRERERERERIRDWQKARVRREGEIGVKINEKNARKSTI